MALEIGGYRVKHPEEIETPAFLVYEDLVRHNIDHVIRTVGSPERLVPHVKTHKSAEVLRLQMAAGIRAFKCATLREAEVLADAGVKEMMLAYPVLHSKKLRRLMALCQQHTGLDIRVIASRPEHLRLLSEAATASGQTIGVYMDLDTGMHRTGVQPGQQAAEFYLQIARSRSLRALGLHVFDGHTAYRPDPQDRQALVQRSLDYIHDAWSRVERLGLDVADNIVAGSWSFAYYVNETRIRVSPGTWIYWDSQNSRMPDLGFRVAAVVLGQVVDENATEDTVTVDIGSKAITDDLATPLRFRVADHERAELISQSEEHGVIRRNASPLAVGDFVLAIPGHVCTTTVKYPYALVLNANGQVVKRYDHSARDREQVESQS